MNYYASIGKKVSLVLRSSLWLIVLIGTFTQTLKAEMPGNSVPVQTVSVVAPAVITFSQLNISMGSGGSAEEEDFSIAIQALILITVLSFGAAFITMMTSFTRIIVVFFFLRMGMGTQQSPPNQVLIGLALFLTIFIMRPTFDTINVQAIQPYINDEITQMEMLKAAAGPLKEFMVKQTSDNDLLYFMDMAQVSSVSDIDNLPLHVAVPAYVISELRIAFQIGFMIYIPFMVIDLVVASILLSMGIMFLPPVMVSLPFKILVFVLTDGWYLLVKSLIESFN